MQLNSSPDETHVVTQTYSARSRENINPPGEDYTKNTLANAIPLYCYLHVEITNHYGILAHTSVGTTKTRNNYDIFAYKTRMNSEIIDAIHSSP